MTCPPQIKTFSTPNSLLPSDIKVLSNPFSHISFKNVSSALETNETFKLMLVGAKKRHQALLVCLNDWQPGGGVT